MIADGSKVWFQALLLLLISFLYVNGYPQDYYEQYTKKDGLPSNECYDTYQDHNGLIWIATDRGLATFDGSTFNVYSLEDGLPNDVVLELFPQNDSTIWCVTLSNDLFYFHPDQLKFHHYKFNHLIKKYGIHQVLNLKVKKDGTVKFRYATGAFHLCEIDPTGNVRVKGFYHNYHKDFCLSLMRDEDGYPYLLSGKRNEYSKGREIDINYIKGARVSSINGSVLITTKEQKSLIDAQNRNVEIESNGEKSYIITSGSYKDKYWISYLSNGFKLYSTKGEILKSYNLSERVTSYNEDMHGGIWLTTQSSGLLYFPSFQISRLTGTANNIIQHVSINENNELVFANNVGEFFQLHADNSISKKHVDCNVPKSQYYFYNSHFYLTNGDITTYSEELGDNFHAVTKFSDNRNALPIQIVLTNIVDADGTFLLKHTPKMLERITDAEYLGKNIVVARADSIIIYSNKKRIASTFNKTRVTDIDIYQNMIICATSGEGIIVYDDQLRVLRRFNKSSGLTNLFINEIILDENVMWLGTRKGLFKITSPFKDPFIEAIDKSHGLESDEILDIEIINDSMYLGTSNGLFYFNIHNWKSIRYNSSRIIFRKGSTTVNGIDVSSLLNLKLKSNIEIGYELISFQQRDGISFRYKIIGLDDKWNETTDRKVLLNSLPPGDYEVVIQPMFNGIPRKETIRQKISILPPYYSTWWFILLIIVGIITGTWLFIRYRVFSKNQELIREILRFTMKRLRPKSLSFVVRSEGKDVRINSNDVLYAESNGNYLTIHTTNNKIVIREKISNFSDLVPDKLEFVQVRRSVIVRKDKITGKNSDYVIVDYQEIKIGPTFRKDIGDIKL